MPKRATHTFESEKDGLKDADLNVFYCLCCGESVLILGPGVELTALPRRAFHRRWLGLGRTVVTWFFASRLWW